MGGSVNRARTVERDRGRGHGGWTGVPRGGMWKEKNKDENSSGSRKRTSRDDDRDDKNHDKESDDTTISPLKAGKAVGKEVAENEEPPVKKLLNMGIVMKGTVSEGVPPPSPILPGSN